ncbi:hypothetical protein N0V82_005562 [Gnomoniopsis sp. IMI 355080]|nr:hypothetical protein N0V82_005562 [Gnomoniopsis sp. IMI 355080]
MQFTTTIFALAAAMGVSADVVFSVSGFSASCVPHSSQCIYDFTLFAPGSGETAATGVDCTKSVTSDGTLPAVTDGTCTDSSRTFTVTKNADGGLTLTASQPITPSSDQSGSYTIPASDLTTSTTGASTQQAYTGPAAFDLSG